VNDMRTMMTILLAAALLQAQDKPAEVKTEPREAVIIPVKTLTGDSFDRLVNLLAVFNTQVRADKNLHTILVYAPNDVVEQMRKVVAELDRPGSEAAIGRNIDMTMTFLKCSSAKVLGAPAPAPLPADLEPVAKQLRAATQYKDIELWDIVPLRLQEGKETQQSERLPGSQPGGAVPTVQIRIHPESVSRKDQGRYVRFDRVQISFRVPVVTGGSQVQMMDFGITTSGDFMEGQKTVLGKVSGMDEDSAIFVVIALKVLD
jgi:hypothetical protein